MSYSKVFGLGLSRTGTTSLHAAALLLRKSTIHYPVQISHKWISGNFSTDATEPFTFYTDTPVPAYFREFDNSCPNSKFILTIRDPDIWINSTEKFFEDDVPNSNKTTWRDVNRLAVYGIIKFNRQRFIDVYNRHCDDVIKYFRNRKNDLLILNVEEESNPWVPLCEFLETDVPVEKYPHMRSPDLGELQYVLPKEIEYKRAILQKLLI